MNSSYIICCLTWLNLLTTRGHLGRGSKRFGPAQGWHAASVLLETVIGKISWPGKLGQEGSKRQDIKRGLEPMGPSAGKSSWGLMLGKANGLCMWSWGIISWPACRASQYDWMISRDETPSALRRFRSRWLNSESGTALWTRLGQWNIYFILHFSTKTTCDER